MGWDGIPRSVEHHEGWGHNSLREVGAHAHPVAHVTGKLSDARPVALVAGNISRTSSLRYLAAHLSEFAEVKIVSDQLPYEEPKMPGERSWPIIGHLYPFADKDPFQGTAYLRINQPVGLIVFAPNYLLLEMDDFLGVPGYVNFSDAQKAIRRIVSSLERLLLSLSTSERILANAHILCPMFTTPGGHISEESERELTKAIQNLAQIPEIKTLSLRFHLFTRRKEAASTLNEAIASALSSSDTPFIQRTVVL